MAFSTDRLGLNDHEIFRKIRQHLPSQQTKSKNLMVCNDEVLFVWDPVEEYLLTLYLRTLDSGHQSHQTLLPEPPPRFTVERVRCSDTGRQVALSGPRGIAVLDVPRRWDGCGKFQAGDKTVRCRNVLLTPSLEVRQVRWHPGSPTDSHLLALTSDNAFRLYSTAADKEVRLLQQWHVGRAPIGGVTSSAKLPLLGGLGDTAVDFDFAPPQKVKPSGSSQEAEVKWPIMVLRGNGDVFSVTAPLAAKNGAQCKAVVRGPLTMYPPADDNYGVDACSILVLQTSPPLLVVGTCAGTLYHCLLLSPEDEGAGVAPNMRDLSLVDDEDAVRKDVSKAWNTFKGNSLAGQPVLHVFESIELELGLSLDEDLLEDASFNCPLHLQMHPTASDRYLVSHEAGIHILFLPIVSQLNKFVEASDDNEDNFLPKFDSQSNSVAEYLLCTRVCASTSGNVQSENHTKSPILGLALSSSPATLIALLSGGEIISLLLSSLHLPTLSLQSFLSSRQNDTTKCNVEPFDEYICKLLKHSGTIPIFKFEEKSMSSPQEALKLMNRVTQLLFEKYFQRHEQAHEVIENRMKRLRRIKDQQSHDLSNLDTERSELKEKLEGLLEKVKNFKTKQEDLSVRAEHVLQHANMKQPALSTAEIQMKNDLNTKQKKLNDLRISLENITKYSLDQKNQLDRLSAHQKKKEVPINEKHQDTIKTNLDQMRKDLTTLVGKVRACEKELRICA